MAWHELDKQLKSCCNNCVSDGEGTKAAKTYPLSPNVVANSVHLDSFMMGHQCTRTISGTICPFRSAEFMVGEIDALTRGRECMAATTTS